jgi:ribosomal L9-like protein
MAPGGAAALKLLGEYDVAVKLQREVTATVKVRIESETEGETSAPKEYPQYSEPASWSCCPSYSEGL